MQKTNTLDALTFKDAVLTIAQKLRNNIYHMKSYALKNEADKVARHQTNAIHYVKSLVNLLEMVEVKKTSTNEDDEKLDLMLRIDQLEQDLNKYKNDAESYRHLKKLMGQ